MMGWLLGKKAPLVRVRTPRPPAVDMSDDRIGFVNLVHQAEGVRRNAPLQGNRRQTLTLWIEVAGTEKKGPVTIGERVLRFARPEPKWERWMAWDTGPIETLKIPTEEDLERERRLAGAAKARLWLETRI